MAHCVGTVLWGGKKVVVVIKSLVVFKRFQALFETLDLVQFSLFFFGTEQRGGGLYFLSCSR